MAFSEVVPGADQTRWAGMIEDYAHTIPLVSLMSSPEIAMWSTFMRVRVGSTSRGYQAVDSSINVGDAYRCISLDSSVQNI